MVCSFITGADILMIRVLALYSRGKIVLSGLRKNRSYLYARRETIVPDPRHYIDVRGHLQVGYGYLPGQATTRYAARTRSTQSSNVSLVVVGGLAKNVTMCGVDFFPPWRLGMVDW